MVPSHRSVFIQEVTTTQGGGDASTITPLKPVNQEVVLEGDPVDPEVAMIEDQEDLGAETVKVEAVDCHLAFAN